MTIINKVKRRAFRWLNQRLEAERTAQTFQNCVLGEGSHLLPEAEIGNIAGDPERIRIGENSHIRGRIQTYGHGGQVDIGDWCYIGIRSEIWSMDSVQIGNRVLIAHDVNIHDGTAHSTDAAERHQHFKDIVETGHPRSWANMPGVHAAPIVIEDDVWISFGVTILKGVRIGKGSIISAGATVIDDVPPGVSYRCDVSPVISSLD